MLIVKSMPGIIKFLFFGIIVPFSALLKKKQYKDHERFMQYKRKTRTYRKKRTTHFNPF